MSPPVPFVDLSAQRLILGGRIDQRLASVMDHCQFILGPEVDELEDILAQRTNRRHCVTCASGTDALQIALMALDVVPGDRVVVPDFTFVATAEAVRLVGAVPVFADVDPITYNLDPVSVEMAWQLSGPSPVGVISVDLFGLPAQGDLLEQVVDRHNAWLITDGAQSFGATRDGRSSLARGKIATTSFYPSKPLGGYGDGGAVFCDDDLLASMLRSIRSHGVGDNSSCHDRIGLTGRLDTLQAAVLLTKLEVFDSEIKDRQRLANSYSDALADIVTPPRHSADVVPVWAQYTVEVEERDKVRLRMEEQGVPTCVFYPKPVHMQTAYRSCPVVPTGTEVAFLASSRVLSLPMHPYLDNSVQDRIISTLCAAVVER
jgi:dTDP-4-amino-4,6-dideoxygalactose transaminase